MEKSQIPNPKSHLVPSTLHQKALGARQTNSNYKKLNSIYRKLFNHFGPQYWWPASSPFEVMVGAILTQNTNWQNVEKAITNLKKNKLLEASKLYNLSHRRLGSLIRPAGYYNIKARRLKNFLRLFLESYKGNTRRMAQEDTLKLREKLLSINGVGEETADSMLLYALSKPAFVIDSYTKRILSRHGFIKEGATYTEAQNLFMQNLNPVTNTKTKHKKNKICNGARKDASHVRNRKSYRKNISNVVKLFNEFHALLVRLAKEFCLKNNPKCDICPLGKIKS